MPYDHISIEQKWQKFWEENQIFRTDTPFTKGDKGDFVPEQNPQSATEAGGQLLYKGAHPKPKKYILDMFPYPSGAGLHVGHPKGYTGTDVVSRYYHAKGYNVLHPMGFDAFGLPAENYAIKTGTHPAITTAENIQTFIGQLKNLGLSYDWDRMVDTTDPGYYKWTQWIFLELFKRGLAYEQDLPINYCPSCKTGLANEEVLSNNTCDRCGTRVERRPIRQWVLKITDYAERLLSDVDDLDWPEGIKEMQRNWIGKSEGCEFEMKLARHPDEGRIQDSASQSMDSSQGSEGRDVPSIRVYTTRVDTVYGMTYAVLAPDHPKVQEFITDEYRTICVRYIEEAKSKSDQDRTADNKEKTGVFTGSYVVNPYNGESVPLWIADYVLGHYGTGAVMAVPAHDERDFEFAKKYDLSIKQSIAPYIVMGGKNAPKDGLQKTERRTVNAIIEYNGKFLVLKEPENYRLLGGGIELGETSLDAIKREITEETGYFDFEIIEEISFSQVFAHGFHHKKQHNNESYDAPCFYVRLASVKQKEIAPSELAWHSIIWEEKSEIAKLLSFEQHQFQWQQFLYADAYTADGKLVNSSEFDGLTSAEARRVLTEKAASEGFGAKKVNYKLRDWLFSRQRYWGEPIPLIHISHEDYARLPRIGKIADARMGEASILSYGGTKDLLEKGADSSQARNDNNGPTESLVIDGQIFSTIYDGINGKIIIDSRLPIVLPEVERYEPAGDGQSPLATVPEWVNVQLAENLTGKRETNTMPQWGGSCWYYIRYMDNQNSDSLAGQDALEYWQNVDEYVGGAEHAVLHLLYARFWHKVLFDAGIVATKEPFQKLVNQGMILAYAYERADGGLVAVDLVEERDGKFFERETGKEVKQVVAKMSKSLKNVVNSDDIVHEYGADTLRLYEMSMGAFTDTAPWNPEAIIGVRRFLDKAYGTFTEGKSIAKDDMKTMKLLHKTVKKVGEDIVEYKFNTAISSLMILLNEGVPTDTEFAAEWKEKFAILLHPFAPHMAEELYNLCHPELVSGSPKKGEDAEINSAGQSVYDATWPEYDDFMLIDDEVTIAVQVNGKLRGTLTCFNGVAQEEVSALAHTNPDIAKWMEGKILVKEIFIPNKMLSIVMRDA